MARIRRDEPTPPPLNPERKATNPGVKQEGQVAGNTAFDNLEGWAITQKYFKKDPKFWENRKVTKEKPNNTTTVAQTILEIGD